MPLYSADVPLIATVYVKANSPAEAQRKIAALRERGGFEMRDDEDAEVPITGRQFNDPSLPDISLSPAVSFGRIPKRAALEVSAEDAEMTMGCGQCEGTGRIEGGLDGNSADEDCPVCNASGMIPYVASAS